MITLHHVPQSRSMRVLWLLNELEVPFGVTLHPYDRSLQDYAFLSLSPAGRIPALEIDGERMFGSGAILQYLCERFPERGMGRAPQDMDRMAWLVWMDFAETVTASVDVLIRQVVRPMGRPDPALIAHERARLRRCLTAVEARLSTPIENRDYLLTSGFSACDVAVGQAVWMAWHVADAEGLPELGKWMARITARPAFQAALPGPEAELIFERDRYEGPDGGKS